MLCNVGRYGVLLTGIYHAFVIFIMLPLALLARGFYRRGHEGKIDDNIKDALLLRQRTVVMVDKAVMTSPAMIA